MIKGVSAWSAWLSANAGRERTPSCPRHFRSGEGVLQRQPKATGPEGFLGAGLRPQVRTSWRKE